MDYSVSGVLTLLCNHTFHCACLAKWSDCSCPVCRFSHHSRPSFHLASRLGTRGGGARTRRKRQTELDATAVAEKADDGGTEAPDEEGLDAESIPEDLHGSEEDDSDENVCMHRDCGSTTNLWMCLVCGHVGCGRYAHAHAKHHAEVSAHPYALEMETGRVWDYPGDGYVHRLLQNLRDGKLVELPPPMPETSGGGATGAAGESSGAEGMRDGAHGWDGEAMSGKQQDKLDAIGLEYSYLLGRPFFSFFFLPRHSVFCERDRLCSRLKTLLIISFFSSSFFFLFFLVRQSPS
jgi:hypothetical protein